MDSKVSKETKDKFKMMKVIYDNIKDFMDDLLEQLPGEEDLLLLRLLLLETVSIELVIQCFNSYVLPFKKIIKERDEQFFLKSEGIFGPIAGSKVNYFKNIWLSSKLDSDDKKNNRAI